MTRIRARSLHDWHPGDVDTPLPRDQTWHLQEGAPRGEPIIEAVVRIYPSRGNVKCHPFSGATVDLAYPSALETRALDRVAVLRHAISTLLDALQGEMTETPSSSSGE